MVAVFGSARPLCAYLFANRWVSRMKVLVHDGLELCLCARRKFHWGGLWRGDHLTLTGDHLSTVKIRSIAYRQFL